MTCTHCGGNNFNWARACDHCGTALSPSATTATPVPEPVQLGTLVVDEETLARARFVRSLFENTPHVFITWTLVAINVAVFVAMVPSAGFAGGSTDVLMRWGAIYGPAVTRGEWWRLLSGVFIHGGLFHLMANMYVLVSIGRLTERLFGNAGYLVLYLLAGIGGALTSTYWHPLTPSVGASGAVFGVMGGVLAFVVRHRHTLARSVLQSFASSVAGAIVLNILLGFAQTNIDMAAHIGGLLAGFGFGLVLPPPPGAATLRIQLRRASTVAVAGVMLAAVIAWQMPPTDDWLAAVRALALLETQTNARMQALNAEPQAATAITRDVLPPWRAMRNRLTGLRLPDAEHSRAATLTRYMDLKTEEWTLFAESIRTDNLELLRQSLEKRQAATRVAETVIPGNRRQAPASSAAADRKLEQVIALTRAVDRVNDADLKAADVYNRGLERLRKNELSFTQMSTLIETGVLPLVQPPLDTLLRTAVPDSMGPVWTRVTRYEQLRIESWTLMSRGLRTRSAELMNQAAKKQQEAREIAGPEGPAHVRDPE